MTPSRDASDDLRELLYGDVPRTRWAVGDEAFQAVRGALDGGDTTGALHELRGILRDPQRASRDYLQAWHELRALGEQPEDPTHLYGVVVDMPVQSGLDTLAVYEDRTARYLNYSGTALVWEAQDEQISAMTQAVLGAGTTIVAQIGPWRGLRPPLRPGLLRLSMLCAGGLYFGEGPVKALSADPMAAPLIDAASRLLQALTRKAAPRPQ
jgi:hypothetical protein